MRGSSAVIFIAGFVCGALCVALLERQAKVQAQPAQTAYMGRAASAGSLPDRPPMHGSGTRLIIPVEGIHAADLRDNFNDVRASHRHEALDIMAPRGTRVLAAGAGRIEKLFLSKPGGLTVYEFDDSRTYCYYYAHLDAYAPGLKEGALVQQGDVLAYVGSTGDASPDAPHLHFAIFKLGPEKRWWQGTAIDPYTFLTRAQ
jgi:murein DD-endopeptidase MepM/ murein hydrolase activator NlpD